MSGPIAAALRELMALGVEGEALIGAVGRIEASMQATDDTREKRRAWDREYRRKKRVSGGNPPDKVDASIPPVSTRHPPDIHPTSTLPSIEEDNSSPTVLHPEKKKEASKSVRLAADWTPTADERAYAESQGLDEQEIDRAAADYRDYWHATGGAKGCKLDWPATWRRWVRTASDHKRERSARLARPAFSGGNGSAPADFASIVARRRLAGQN